MADFLHDEVLDDGLQLLTDVVDKLVLCSQQPTTYTEAITTYNLANKSTPTVSAPQDGDASGRKVTISAISDGTVDANGTATHYALVDVSLTKLLAAANLSASQVVTSGNTFTLTEFDITIPDPV